MTSKSTNALYGSFKEDEIDLANYEYFQDQLREARRTAVRMMLTYLADFGLLAIGTCAAYLMIVNTLPIVPTTLILAALLSCVYFNHNHS
jgi:hypothetical protein